MSARLCFLLLLLPCVSLAGGSEFEAAGRAKHTAGDSNLGVRDSSASYSSPSRKDNTQDPAHSMKSKDPNGLPQIPICYVSFDGNDQKDGKSWTTAKGTIMACYDALPEKGGTIFIAQGGGGDPDFVRATDTPGQGIWILGGTDPNFKHPPSGWRRSKGQVSFIGVAATSLQSNGHKGGAVEIVSGGAAHNQPAVWLSGVAAGYLFRNLKFAYAGRGIVIGEDSNGGRSGKLGVSGVTFDNVMAALVQNPSAGPTVDVTGSSFWLFFRDCVFDGNYAAPSIDDNKHAAMLFDGTGIEGQGLIYIQDTNLNGGGIKYVSGSGIGSMSIRNVTEEGDYTHNIPPVVWITPRTNGGSFTIDQVQTADPGYPAPPAVRIDGGSPGDVVATSIAANNGAPNIVGPATILSQSSIVLNSQRISPLRQGAVGFANGHVVGQVDDARRNFPPVGVRFQNIASQIPSSWKLTQYCGNSKLITEGVHAPDGSQNAARAASDCASPANTLVFYQQNQPIQIGDYFISGVWVRSVAGNGFAGSPVNPLQLSINSKGYSTIGLARGAIESGDGEWVWVWSVLKVTAVANIPAQVNFGVNVAKNYGIEGFAPVLIYIPSGVVSDNEAYEIGNDLESFPDTASPGDVSTLRNQRMSIGGSTNYFAKLTHSCKSDCTQNFPTGASNDLAATNAEQVWKSNQIAMHLVTPTIGGGAAINKYDVLSASIKPSSVPARICAEQTFSPESLSKLAPSDHIYVNSNVALTAMAFPVNYRVSSAGTLAITYCNPTEGAVTPTASAISLVVWR
jgi:hypothetical protein